MSETMTFKSDPEHPIEEVNIERVGDENQEKQVGGYGLGDLLKAPVKPPQPIVTESKRATNNQSVKFIVVVGILVFVVGLVFVLFFNALFGMMIVLLGGLAIVAGVFAPIK